MDDIHTPTVASGPTSGSGPVNGLDTDKLSLMDLISEKTRVEEELSALGIVLDSVRFCLSLCRLAAHKLTCTQHGVNMNTTLTTFDGYPRDDLDIAQSVCSVCAPLELRMPTSLQ